MTSKKKKVRTNQFKLGKYYIDLLENSMDGLCDVPSQGQNLHMHILNNNTKRSLASTIHEAMHGEGIPDKYLDGDRDSAEQIANFLWRLGWRRR